MLWRQWEVRAAKKLSESTEAVPLQSWETAEFCGSGWFSL